MANPIPVEWIEQITDYFCGPAVAAMIIKALGVNAPGGVVTDEDWQRLLWEDIKRITPGPKRPPDADECPGYLEEFERQQCFSCSDDECSCWAATPQALRVLLNNYLKPTRVSIHRSGSIIPIAFVATLMRSVDAGVPAAVGSGDRTHWIVVRGYSVGKAGEGTVINGKPVTGIYVRDPQVSSDSAGTGYDLVDIDEFMNDLGFVDCGAKVDTGKMVAILSH